MISFLLLLSNNQRQHCIIPASTTPPLCLFVCDWWSGSHTVPTSAFYEGLRMPPESTNTPTRAATDAGRNVCRWLGSVEVRVCGGCVGGSTLLQDLTSAGPGTTLLQRRSGKIAAGISPLFVSVDLLLNPSVLFNWKIQQDWS